MKSPIVAAGLLVCAIAASAAAQHSSAAQKTAAGPTAHTTQGSLLGSLDGTTAVFKGIPYAAPPVGDLRWRPPQPAAAWNGTRNATQYGSPCTQDPAGVDRFLSVQADVYKAAYQKVPVVSSEDCLYLNLWVPAWDAQNSRGSQGNLPVMVFFHGGSNVVGSASEPGYDGKILASHGVILVTVNYRLGMMGYFAHPALTAESPHHSSGNYGLLDQLQSLAWVRQNIAQFGGNPQNVTVFGESAGAVDIGHLLISPLSTGMFQRAISESGPAFGLGPAVPLAKGESIGNAVSASLNNASLQQLRSMPATQLMQLDAKIIKDQFPGLAPGNPVVDGWVVPEPPAKLYAEGRIQNVQLMIGLNQREFSAFRAAGAAAAKSAPPAKQQGNPLKTVADAVHPLYGAWTDIAIGTYLAQALTNKNLALDNASTEMLAACPIAATASLATAAGRTAYVYRFDRTVPGKGESELGAFHSLELPYLFGTFDSREWQWMKFTDADRKLAATMQAYWTQFAKTGTPNPPGLPAWPQWSYPQESFLNFTQPGQAVVGTDFPPRFCYVSPSRVKEMLLQ